MMPGIDGFEVARRLRNQGVQLPILFLTARDATEDKVRGLTLGGDDYMTKPFSVEELVARIRAILRRVQPAAAAQSRLAFADLELDEDTHEVWRAGREIELTATEFKLLRYLMLNARHVLSKDQILDHVWNYDFGGNANIVETYVSYLRRKVDADGAPLIHTVEASATASACPRTERDFVSLRTRLLLAVLALVAVALVVAGAVTYVSLRNFLLERVDQQLLDARVPVSVNLERSLQNGGSAFGIGGPGVNLPIGSYAQLRSSDGTVLIAGVVQLGQSTGYAQPVLPSSCPARAADRRVFFTVTKSTGGPATDFRVAVSTARRVLGHRGRRDPAHRHAADTPPAHEP